MKIEKGRRQRRGGDREEEEIEMEQKYRAERGQRKGVRQERDRIKEVDGVEGNEETGGGMKREWRVIERSKKMAKKGQKSCEGKEKE